MFKFKAKKNTTEFIVNMRTQAFDSKKEFMSTYTLIPMGDSAFNDLNG